MLTDSKAKVEAISNGQHIKLSLLLINGLKHNLFSVVKFVINGFKVILSKIRRHNFISVVIK